MNPGKPEFYLTSLAEAYVAMGSYSQASVVLERILSRRPQWLMARALLAVCYMHLGRKQDAVNAIAMINEQSPRFSIRRWIGCIFYPHRADVPDLMAALRDAGMQES
ncbi:MAG: hypothetical protein DHS20C01_33550 [marine bacterium B5-7]|nr:MAG: hypothetical protein DHS20C01_33550 [marine bacterium B5-7]